MVLFVFSFTRVSGIRRTLVVRSNFVRVSSSVVKQLVVTIPRNACLNKTAIPTATENSGTAKSFAAVPLAVSGCGRGFRDFLELNRDHESDRLQNREARPRQELFSCYVPGIILHIRDCS